LTFASNSLGKKSRRYLNPEVFKPRGRTIAKWVCTMQDVLKVYILDTHLDNFKENTGAYSKE